MVILTNYHQYEVGVGTEGSTWVLQQWRPRNDHWTDAQKIGVSPNACELVSAVGAPNGWISYINIPAITECRFNDEQHNAIKANADETRRFIHKYQDSENQIILKEHCGAMITVNGKTMPRYLTKGDTLCKSALVGQSYAEFVEDICSKNPTAEYCACYNRFTDPAFMADGNVVPYEDAACWYKPCVFNTGFKDPRLTSTCETNICPRVLANSGVSICE